MPKKSRRGRSLLFPSRPHFDGVVGLAKDLIYREPFLCWDYWQVRRERWEKDKAAIRARRRWEWRR